MVQVPYKGNVHVVVKLCKGVIKVLHATRVVVCRLVPYDSGEVLFVYTPERMSARNKGYHLTCIEALPCKRRDERVE